MQQGRADSTIEWEALFGHFRQQCLTMQGKFTEQISVLKESMQTRLNYLKTVPLLFFSGFHSLVKSTDF